ncbi:MAG: ATP-binding protein [Bacteroides sp.]|nr:ATP-binding protein [Bacteroides sp.]MBD5262387.1 ATP-binding protein [Bacteroides sp.]MBD5263710.1 ATP-binding protein [Bacteroides sp.]
MIKRNIEAKIIRDFRRNKIITLLGPRQVGKTTLLEQIIEEAGNKKIMTLNCDDDDDRMLLQDKSSTELKNLIGNNDIVMIDEAQRVENIGLTLKKIGDLKTKSNIMVTGSSSLNLGDKINEPATGRLIEYNLFPFTVAELADHTSWREEQRMLNQRLIYGLYPEVVMYPEDARRTLMTISNSYLYKDLLSYDGVRKPALLQNIVRALALQVGSEVSYNELAQLVGADKTTVEKYIDLLEKCFVVFRLPSYSRNLRNEIKKGKKIYFYDNGIRNAVLSNFATPEFRTDMGALWENFLVSERLKRNVYSGSYAQMFFWRTQSQQEIDYIEECDGQLNAFEFKWNPKTKASIPKTFIETYPGSSFEIISPENYEEFIR